MKTIVIVIASLALAKAAVAAAPEAGAWSSDAPVRGDMSSFERGFLRMLTRSNDAPVQLTLRNELDAVDLLVAKALAADARCALRPVSRRR